MIFRQYNRLNGVQHKIYISIIKKKTKNASLFCFIVLPIASPPTRMSWGGGGLAATNRQKPLHSKLLILPSTRTVCCVLWSRERERAGWTTFASWPISAGGARERSAAKPPPSSRRPLGATSALWHVIAFATIRALPGPSLCYDKTILALYNARQITWRNHHYIITLRVKRIIIIPPLGHAVDGPPPHPPQEKTACKSLEGVLFFGRTGRKGEFLLFLSLSPSSKTNISQNEMNRSLRANHPLSAPRPP